MSFDPLFLSLLSDSSSCVLPSSCNQEISTRVKSLFPMAKTSILNHEKILTQAQSLAKTSFEEKITGFINHLEGLSTQQQVNTLLELYQIASNEEEKRSALYKRLKPHLSPLIQALFCEMKKPQEKQGVQEKLSLLCYLTHASDYPPKDMELDLLLNLAKKKGSGQNLALKALLNVSSFSDLKEKIGSDLIPYLVKEYSNIKSDHLLILQLMINLSKKNPGNVQRILDHHFLDFFFLSYASPKELFYQTELLENALYSSDNQTLFPWVSDALVEKLVAIHRRPIGWRFIFSCNTYQHRAKKILSALCILSPMLREKVLKNISLDELKKNILRSRGDYTTA